MKTRILISSIIIVLASLNVIAQPTFKKGVGWAFFRDLTHESFADKFDKYRADGYRLIDIDAYSMSGGTRYAMIWEKNTDGRGWAEWRGLTNDEYHVKWEDFRARNFRPSDIEGYNHNGLKFAGIWVENTEGYRWSSRRGMNRQEFGDYITEQRNDGKRLVNIDIYISGNGTRYAAIFLENKENIDWVEGHHLTRAAYQNRVDELTAQGYLISNFESYMDNNVQRFAFIAEKRPGFGFQIRSDRSELQFANMWREFDDKGYRIVDFECYPTASGMQYGGAWIENSDRYRYDKKSQLDQVIKQYRDDNDVPGISVAIIKDGDMIYRKGEGYADVEARKVAWGETVYLTASIAKVIAGTIAVKLHDEKRLQDGTAVSFDVNDTTASHLTNVRKTDGTIVTIPAHHTHKVNQIFAHIACTHNDYDADTDPAVRQYSRSIDALTQFWDLPLLDDCTIGEDYNYSNHGYVFIAAILEKVSGRSSPDLVKRELAIPYDLGTLRALNETASVPQKYDRAIPYTTANQPSTHANKSWKVFAGGLEISAVDLSRFGWKLLNGEIVRPAARDNILWTMVDSGSSSRRGIGWVVKSVRNRRVAEHGGSFFGARSLIRIYRDDKVVIAIMSNKQTHRTEDPNDLAQRIEDIVF